MVVSLIWSPQLKWDHHLKTWRSQRHNLPSPRSTIHKHWFKFQPCKSLVAVGNFGYLNWWTCSWSLSVFPRIFQHTPGTYPRPSTNSLWRNSFHLGVWGGLGYAPGVCWGSLRVLKPSDVTTRGPSDHLWSRVLASRRPWQKLQETVAVTGTSGTICAGVDPLLNIGDGHDPPLIGNPDSGYITPQLLGWWPSPTRWK